MRLRRTIAALTITLAASAAALVGAASAASAAPAPKAPAPAAATVTEIWNFNSAGPSIGVLRTYVGYGPFYSALPSHNYDFLVGPGRLTFDGRGFYIGPHYRADTYLLTGNANWIQHAGAPGHPALNSGWYQISTGQQWRVYPRPCSC